MIVGTAADPPKPTGMNRRVTAQATATRVVLRKKTSLTWLSGIPIQEVISEKISEA